MDVNFLDATWSPWGYILVDLGFVERQNRRFGTNWGKLGFILVYFFGIALGVTFE